MEGEERWNGGGLRPRDRLPGGAGARARRPGNEPAGGAGGLRSWRAVGAGPLPARPGAVRSWRAVGAVGPLPCPRELLASAPAVRSRAGPHSWPAACGPGTGRRVLAVTGGRDWRVRERERREGIRLEGFTRA